MRHAPLAAIVAVGLALALAACSDPEPAPPAEPPPPPVRAGLYMAAERGAEPFARALYADYGQGLPEAVPPGREPLYGRTLNALIGEDFRRNGDRRALTRDPVCDCDDSAGLALSSLEVAETGAATAEARAVFALDGHTRAQTLALVREGPMWRVADVTFDGQRPLSETLRDAIE